MSRVALGSDRLSAAVAQIAGLSAIGNGVANFLEDWVLLREFGSVWVMTAMLLLLALVGLAIALSLSGHQELAVVTFVSALGLVSIEVGGAFAVAAIWLWVALLARGRVAVRQTAAARSPSASRTRVYVGAWVGVTLLGYLFAAGAGHFPGSFPVGTGLRFDVSAALIGAVFGAVGGLVIGALQWWVLRAWLGISWVWIPATAIAVATTHALGDGLPARWTYREIAIIGGVVLAAALWSALRGRGDRLPIALTAGAGFALGVALGAAAADPMIADWQRAHAVAAAVTGLVFAVAMARPLALMAARA